MAEKENLDNLLAQTAEKVEVMAEEAAKDQSYGLFCLLIKHIEPSGLQTYTNVAGISGVIAEGLYAELASQIEAGDFNLYALLREVLDDLKDDYDITSSGDDDSPIH